MIKYKNFVLRDRLNGVLPYANDLITPEHKKYHLEIKINNEFVFNTTYQFNPKYCKFEKNDGLLVVIFDALAFRETKNYDDFCTFYGYEAKDAKAYKAYRACEKAYMFFKLPGLTLEDLEDLQELLNK